jgi:hypothetical protein
MAITPANTKPTSLPAGATTDPPYGPLYNSGFSNPFFYHNFSDDFDNMLGSAGLYTTTSVGGGTVAHAAGDGGLALFTTGATAGNFESIQLPAASITLPGTGNAPPGTSTSMKKLFYLVRLQLSDVTNTALIAGLCATTATPFTGAGAAQNVADGLYFYKASGGTALQVVNIASNAGSPTGTGFTNTFTIPTAAYTLANATNIDLAYYVDRSQNLSMYVGSQLVGWLPQSGTGAVQGAGAGTTVLPVVGPALVNYNYQAQAGPSFNPTNPIMFTTVNLNITLAVGTSAASAKTMTADFQLFQKER